MGDMLEGLSVDSKGKVRYAYLTKNGKTSKIRVPLHIFNMTNVERQKAMMESLLLELHKRFVKEHIGWMHSRT